MSGALAPEAETIIRQTDQINRLMGQSASRIDQVQRSLDQAWASQQRFQQAQTTINAALERGRISQDRANTLLQLARERYQQAGTAAQQFAASNDNAARGGRNFGQVIGQAGFQVQDFFVQVQGGTNALTAFSQQGSQLLGIFGPAGAIAGAALAIGALVAGLLTAGSATDRFRQTMEEVSQTYERNSAHANRWREGLEQERNRVLDLTGAYENMNQAQREFERRRLLADEVRLRTAGRTLERDTDRELQDVRRTLERQIQAAREQTFRNRQFDPTAAAVAVPPDLALASQALTALSEPGTRTVDQIRELSRQLADAAQNAGPFAELLRDTSGALDALVPRWAEYSQAVERNRRDLAANEEAARRNGQATAEMGGAHSVAQAQIDGVTQALARQVALYNQATSAANSENRLALQRAQQRAAAIAQGPEAAALFDAEQRRRDAANQYYDEQTRRDRERLSQARATEDQIRTFLGETEAERRRVAEERAALESRNDLELERRRQAASAARSGAAAGRRETRLDDQAKRQRDQLLASLGEEQAATVRLEQAMTRLEAARRRDIISAAEEAELRADVIARHNEEINRLRDKTALDTEQTKRVAELTSELGNIMGDVFQDLVRDGKSFEDTLKNLERQLLRLGDKYLLQPLLDQLAQLALAQVGIGGGSNGGGGGLGGVLSALAGVSGGAGGIAEVGGSLAGGAAGQGLAKGAEAIIGAVLHDGGVAGVDGGRRAVPAEVFLDAPRYHSGGFAGRMPFASDEVPAILRRGEVVLNDRQQEAVAGRMAGMTVINNITTPSVGDFRSSGAQISADMARVTSRAAARNR